MDARSWRRGFAGIVVVAILTRLAIIIGTPHFAPWGDPADYQLHAALIAAGHGYPATVLASPGTPSAYRPPAYPYLLGGTDALFGTTLLVGRLLAATLGVAVVALLAYLGRALWTSEVGLLAGALAAIFLPLIALNATLLSEPLLLVLELALALVLVAITRSRLTVRWALLAGALCGLAALTRPVALLLLLPCLAVIGRSSASFPRRIRACAALIGAVLVVLAPWTIRNASAFHTLVPISTEGGFTFAGQYNGESGRDGQLHAVWVVPLQVASVRTAAAPLFARPGGVNEAQLDARLRQAAFTYLRRHPSELPIALWLNGLRLLDLGVNHTFTTSVAYRELGLPTSLWKATTLSAQLVALVALIGIVCGLIGVIRLPLGPWWLWSIPILLIVATIAAVGTPRYRAPADPFLLLLASLVITATTTRIGKPVRGKAAHADGYVLTGALDNDP